jgi:hypothetical protein
MVTTWGATLAWSATTVTVAGAVDGRLGGRLGCILSGVVAGAVAGDWATVDAAGVTVCAGPATVKQSPAVQAIKNIVTRWEFVLIVLLNNFTTNCGCSD